jgi:hypothetical protein
VTTSENERDFWHFVIGSHMFTIKKQQLLQNFTDLKMKNEASIFEVKALCFKVCL